MFYITIPVKLKARPDDEEVLKKFRALEEEFRSHPQNNKITLTMRANPPHFTILGPIKVPSGSVFEENMQKLLDNLCVLLRLKQWRMTLTLAKYGFVDANHYWYGGIFNHDDNYNSFYQSFIESIRQTWTELVGFSSP
mgnify:CR=1 FL=1